jgi:hypothetical protein
MKKYRLHLLFWLSLILALGALDIHAQRSTSTSVQWDPGVGVFHLMANGIDYPVQNTDISTCGTTVACADTLNPSPIIVSGNAAFAATTTITLTGLPFTSTTSYDCVATDATTAANAVMKIANASASSTVITDSNSSSDVVHYICIGT